MMIDVPWMVTIANLDARNLDKVYLILMKQNEDVRKFYKWNEKLIVEPFFRNLLQSYCSISNTYTESIPEYFDGIFWVDSDMRQMARLILLEVMQENYAKVLHYSKIGSK